MIRCVLMILLKKTQTCKNDFFKFYYYKPRVAVIYFIQICANYCTFNINLVYIVVHKWINAVISCSVNESLQVIKRDWQKNLDKMMT